MSERTQAQEERTRSLHRDACHDQQQQFTVDWQVWVYFGRPRLTSKLIASRGGVWKYANAQWAFYPNGGGISTRGAVTPAWFYNRPYPAHVDASDLEVTFYWPAEYSGLKVPRCTGELSEEGPSFLVVVSHNPFFLKEIKAISSITHPFSLVPRLFRPNAGTE